MVEDMRDIRTEIVTESIRRRVRQVEKEIDSGTIELPVDCSLSRRFDVEQLKKLVALNIAMMSIIKSVKTN